MRRVDLTALVGGVALLIVGLFLLLDSTGELRLTVEWAGPLILAAIGATLLASGLRDRDAD